MHLIARWLVLLLVLNVVGCGGHRLVHPSTWHRPWHHKAAPVGLAAVNVLAVQVADGQTAPQLPQHWERNTLVVDLSLLSGTGTWARSCCSHR